MGTSLNVFDMQAEVGVTKHPVNIRTTEALVRLCQINADSTVLDVGCGTGHTPCYLAKTYGCRVVGVDILEPMLEQAAHIAKRMKVEHLVEFRVADAQALPFEDNLFDAVICESVVAFPPDKQKTVNELARVTRPGGTVGMSESTWLKTPVPEAIQAWVTQDMSSHATLMDAEGWAALLEGAQLEDIAVETHALDVKREAIETIQRYGLGHILRAWGRGLRMYLTKPETRGLLSTAAEIPKNLFEYFGYGIYAGRKPG